MCFLIATLALVIALFVGCSSRRSPAMVMGAAEIRARQTVWFETRSSSEADHRLNTIGLIKSALRRGRSILKIYALTDVNHSDIVAETFPVRLSAASCAT